MYKIQSISLLYDNNFENRIKNIKDIEPNIKIYTNHDNNLDIEYFDTNDKFSLIEYCIKNNKNTLFLDRGYVLKNKLLPFETQKDLGLLKINNNLISSCIFCENIKCIPYLKDNNLNKINFLFNFIVISNKFIHKNSNISLFIHYKNDNQRKTEYLTCINKNISNLEIDNIYYFSSQRIEPDELTNKDFYYKLQFIEFNEGSLSFHKVFKYINDNNINGYKIISYPDVYFKEMNLSNNFNLLETKYSNQEIILSLCAYNINNFFEMQENNHIKTIESGINHKALIFDKNIILDDPDIKLDDYNSINYINHILKENKFNIFNPCELIKIYHFDNIFKNKNQKNSIKDKNYFIVPNLDFDKLSFNNINDNIKDDDYNYYLNLSKTITKYIKIIN
jgi:hypothetical protein